MERGSKILNLKNRNLFSLSVASNIVGYAITLFGIQSISNEIKIIICLFITVTILIIDCIILNNKEVHFRYSIRYLEKRVDDIINDNNSLKTTNEKLLSKLLEKN